MKGRYLILVSLLLSLAMVVFPLGSSSQQSETARTPAKLTLQYTYEHTYDSGGTTDQRTERSKDTLDATFFLEVPDVNYWGKPYKLNSLGGPFPQGPQGGHPETKIVSYSGTVRHSYFRQDVSPGCTHRGTQEAGGTVDMSRMGYVGVQFKGDESAHVQLEAYGYTNTIISETLNTAIKPDLGCTPGSATRSEPFRFFALFPMSALSGSPQGWSAQLKRTPNGISGTASFEDPRGKEVRGWKAGITVSFTLDIGGGGPPQPERPTVALAGCADVPVGRKAELTAEAKPPGGHFRWSVQPEGVVALADRGDSAALACKAPGRATVQVEYTAPNGKTAADSRAGSCVRLKSVNRGTPIPQVAQYDAKGKHTDWVQSVPIQVEPADGGELLSFRPTNPAIVTAVPRGGTLQLQGVQPGKTTVQPQTQCGEKVGLALEVEVVVCHKDYVAKLRKDFNLRLFQGKGIHKAIQDRLNDPGFEKAADEIAHDTFDVAFSTAKAILSTIGAKSTKITAGAEIGSSLFTGLDWMLKAMKGEFGDVAFDMTLERLEAKRAAGLKDVFELMAAAEKFGRDLGTLIATAGELRDSFKLEEENTRKFNEVSQQLDLCKLGSGKAPEKAKRPPQAKPQPPSPEPKETAVPSDAEPPPQSEPGEPPPPPRPPAPPKPGGAPMGGLRCGCGGRPITAAPPPGAEGLAAVSQGFRQMKGCVDAFRTGPLAGFQRDLQQWQRTLEQVERAAKLPDDQRRRQFSLLRPQVEAIKSKASVFGRAGEEFSRDIEVCDTQVSEDVRWLREQASRDTP